MPSSVIILPKTDLDQIIADNESFFRKADEARFLITGGTGFVGSWIWQTLQRANQVLDLDFQVFVLSRYQLDCSSLSHSNVQFLKHDLLNPIPENFPSFDFVLSSITPSQPKSGGLSPDYVRRITALGNRHLIEHLRAKSNPVNFFNTSSGAVTKYNSASRTSSNSINDTYMRAKAELEEYLNSHHQETGIRIINARLFTFFGPGIPLDAHFAIGNFLNDALNGRPVKVLGNLNTIRSYLYPTDMVSQIFGAWFDSNSFEPIPIGSYSRIKIKDLAENISQKFGNGVVEYAKNHSPLSIYLPQPFDSNRAQMQKIDLNEGMGRWVQWLQTE